MTDDFWRSKGLGQHLIDALKPEVRSDTPADDAKPAREWWLFKPEIDSKDPHSKNNEDIRSWVVDDYDGQNENLYGHARKAYIHVIEYAAYQRFGVMAFDLSNELVEITNERDAVTAERDEYKNNAQEYSLELLYTQQERDKLKAEATKWMLYATSLDDAFALLAKEKDVSARLAEVLRAFKTYEIARDALEEYEKGTGG